jgi:hypothetical protein
MQTLVKRGLRIENWELSIRNRFLLNDLGTEYNLSLRYNISLTFKFRVFRVHEDSSILLSLKSHVKSLKIIENYILVIVFYKKINRIHNYKDAIVSEFRMPGQAVSLSLLP